MAMGHAISASNTFAKIKSADVSPDGSLGGKGYIQKIADMRRAYMNAVEALSALSDTLHDEIKAPHWHQEITDGGPRERAEVQDILQDAAKVEEDPEGWAEEEEESMEDGEVPQDPSEDPTEVLDDEPLGDEGVPEDEELAEAYSDAYAETKKSAASHIAVALRHLNARNAR